MNSIFSAMIFTADLNKQINFIQNQSTNILDVNLKSEFVTAERPHRLLSLSALKKEKGKYHQEKVKSRSGIYRLYL